MTNNTKLFLLKVLFFLMINQLWSQNDIYNITPNSKMESIVWDIYKSFNEKGQTSSLQVAKQALFHTKDKKIKVIANFEGDILPLEELNNLGVEEDNIFIVRDNKIQMMIPIKNLLKLSELPNIIWIQKPTTSIPLVVSEGERIIEAKNYKNLNFYGQGVKVAVIDCGFEDYDKLLGSELPNDVKTKSFYNDVNGNGDITGDGHNHGTACAEIIYDIAPQAELYLINYDSDEEFRLAVEYAINNNIDIISCSMGWLNSSNYDGTGFICDITQNAKDNGILWVNSAGNHAERHYEGIFKDDNSNKFHEFNDDDETTIINAVAGQKIRLYLSWNDWPCTSNDYDLYLYYNDLFVAKSYNRQTGTQPPTEALEFDVLESGFYHIKILNYNSNGNAHFELYSWEHNLLKYNVTESSLLDPAPANSVLSVGATYWQDDTYENYSSQGPTNDGRIKPDLIAPSAVSNQSYGNFRGTSASCPHIAGAAALILSQNPYLSPDHLQNYLENSTVDMGIPGKDNLFGSGKLQLTCVNLKNPIDEGKLFAGDLYNIEWSIRGQNVNTFNLFYSTKGENEWNFITSITNDSSYVWLIPDNSSSNCRIKVVALNDNNKPIAEDISDNYFRIYSTSSNIRVCTYNHDQTNPQIIKDGQGGAIIVWEDKRQGNYWNIYAQRININGETVWKKDGIQIGFNNEATVPITNPLVVNDGQGGAFIAWTNIRNELKDPPESGIIQYVELYIQKIDSDGNPEWQEGGFPILPGHPLGQAKLVADGAGGVIIAGHDGRDESTDTDIYAQRISANGSIVWNINGMPVCRANEKQFGLQMVADGYGGAVIIWKDYRNGRSLPSAEDIYAQRINANGDALWQTNGVPICTSENVQKAGVITNDGQNSFIIAWQDMRFSSGLYDIYAQKININGVIQWQNNGIPICTTFGYQGVPLVVADGSGGAIIGWADGRYQNADIFAQKIDTNGIHQWIRNGVAVCRKSGNQDYSVIISDDQGGAIFSWQDDSGVDYDIYAQKISNNGIIQWDTNGFEICGEVENQGYPAIISDDNYGAIITWKDNRWSDDTDIYAEHIINDGTVPVELMEFYTIVNENTIRILWKTVTETNNFGFEIERSIDNKNFEKIAFINGQATTVDPQNYEFIDKDITFGTLYYYRLKQIDLDGTYKYSKIIKTKIISPTKFELFQNYPNPFNPITKIKYQLPKDCHTIIKVYNIYGQEIKNLVEQDQQSGVYSIVWDGKNNEGMNVSSGCYIYTIQAGEFRASKKIIFLN